jgi:hypothetical protein
MIDSTTSSAPEPDTMFKVDAGTVLISENRDNARAEFCELFEKGLTQVSDGCPMLNLSRAE